MTESTKTVDGTISKYEYVGDQLLFEQRGEKAIHYVYDSFGNVMAAVYKANASDTEHIYYYAHNWRGDVVALYTSTGNIFARYEYDAWGKLLSVKNGYGNIITSPANFALINPIRYRGYYYDSESGLYYLQSRYYDPEIGRFINADDEIAEDAAPSNINLYTYCQNNTTITLDNDGHAVTWLYRAECVRHFYTNRRINISGYIYNQKTGPASLLRVGFSNTAFSGCGWVATYNAALMLGRYYSPADIIYRYELSGAFCGGFLGINPYSVINYFFYRYCKVTVTYDINKYDAIAKRNRANILVFTHSRGAHYVAVKWIGYAFIGYNTYSNSTKGIS